MFKAIFNVVVLLSAFASGGFVHPGMLHTQADFTRMAQKVAANASPWIDSYNILTANYLSHINYGSNPQTFISHGTGCDPTKDNSFQIGSDAEAAYLLALRWKISGNTSYADASVSILNGWSSTLTGFGCINGSGTEYLLTAGIQGYQFANTAEILRNYSGFTAANFTAFKNMMVNIFLPLNNALPQLPLSPNTNWELCAIASWMAIGILVDNQTIFNNAITYFQTGIGNGAIAQAIYYVHPGYLGQVSESGRDQDHNTLDIAHLGVIAAMAWNQGVDLYAFANNRILAASEYVAQGNLIQSGSTYYTVPYVTHVLFHQPVLTIQFTFSNVSIGYIRPCWASIYNHYVNVKGIAAPYTGQMMNLVAPDDAGPDFAQFGFQTLTFTLDPIASGAAPSGLTATISYGSVVLSWYGTAYATGYNIQRSTSSTGPFTTIGSVSLPNPLNYTDSPAAGTYYYVIVATNSSGSYASSSALQVVTKPQQLNTYLTFDASSVTVAVDASGNGNNGTLVRGATIVPGKIGNAVSLNGTSQYVSLPPNILANLSDFTVATWVYLNSITNWTRVFDFGFGPGRWMYFTPSSGSNAIFNISINVGAYVTLSAAPLPTGQWVHIAITLFGQTATYYVNGVQASQNTQFYLNPQQIYSWGATTVPAQNWLGRSQYSTDPYLDGLIDDFRLYQGALTSAQILGLANPTLLNTYLAFNDASGTIAVDSSGNGNNGTLVNGSSFVTGQNGYGVQLYGNGSYVRLSSGVLSTQADFSITAWVYLNSIATWARIFDFGTGNTSYMYFTAQSSSGYARFGITTSGSTAEQQINATSALPTGVWVHIAVTLSGNVGTLYVNGTVTGSSTRIYISPFQLGSTTNNWIGRSQFSNNPYLNGIVDEFRIYQGALTSAQILGLANPTLLKTYLALNASSGTIAVDSSGNGNSGTLVNGSSFVTGQNGHGVQLYGNGSYVSLPNGVLSTQVDFSITAWVYLNSSVPRARIFDFGTGTTAYMYLTPQSSYYGYALFGITTSGSTAEQQINATSALPTGVWVHVAVTLSGNVGTLYVNGTVTGSNTGIYISPFQLGSTTNNWIGRSRISTNPYLNGIVDEFRIYQGALSAAQVLSLFTST